MAGMVKARGDARRARSDWMKVEQERGISVSASAMNYEYGGCTFNLLDTPGHEDFSEDTYRTLTAVDSAIMVIDAAKGIEAQTLKLFEVCRMRDVPVITFINKMDREARDSFELLDEIEQKLALDVSPASWPIGSGQRFLGCYDLFKEQLILMDRKQKDSVSSGIRCQGLADSQLDSLLPPEQLEDLRAEVAMARGLCPEFRLQSYLEGHMTPVFFGSALNNFGVRELLDGIAELAPTPRGRVALERAVEPDEEAVSGFVFKIQANMDPKHRDRIAFVRVISGHFQRGAKLKHVPSGSILRVHNPVMFLAQDREIAEDAWPGDIIGIPNHGKLRVGDTLTEGEELHFTGIPTFAPEMIQTVRTKDPLKAKHLERALVQLAEEGAASCFKTRIGSTWLVGVVGSLQFDVLADRIRTEYNIDVLFEGTSLQTARWIETPDQLAVRRFEHGNLASMADDHIGQPVFLARNDWHLERTAKDFPDLRFLKTRER
ncbi:MAG: hypothetical protein RJA70_3288 [Pseudomonadota bacterium]